MRSQLQTDGKIPVPGSLATARERLAQVEFEVSKVQAQLDDIGRAAGYRSRVAYGEWRERAKASRGYLTEEARQLEEWIANNLPLVDDITSERDYANFWND